MSTRSRWWLTILICLVVLNLAAGTVFSADNPPRHEIYEAMKTIGKEYNIPPEILYAVGYTESGLEQYEESGEVLVSPDGGIGIMQVTPGHVSLNYDLGELKYNWKYNVRKGAEVLKSKWNLKNKITTNDGRTGSWIPVIGNGNPMVLESWYFALWAYNGYVGENNPNELPKWIGYVGSGYYKEEGYQEKVFNALTDLGFAATELPASRLPNSGVPPVGAHYETPQPKHYSVIADQTSINDAPKGNLVLKSLHTTALDQFPAVEVVAKVANKTKADIKDSFTVTLYNNDKVIEKKVSGLKAGAVEKIVYNPQIKTTGEYNYSLLIDSKAEIKEGNEKDNKVKGTIKVTEEKTKKAEAVVDAKASRELSRNLRVKELKVLGKERSTGSYKLAAEVVNTGNAPIDNKVYVTLYMNQKHYQVPVTDIASWEKKTIVFRTDISYPDTYHYSVLADSKSMVREASELDNKLYGVVNLQNIGYSTPANSDLTITYPEQIVMENQVEFRGQVADKADKIIASVDGYKIAEKSVNADNNFEFNYKFSKPGWNRRLVIKSFTSKGKTVNEITTRIRVLKDRQLTVNYPDPIVTGKHITINGQALHPIHKVIVSMDGYVLEEEVVKDGIYKITCKINQPGESRELVVKAFDENGKAVKEAKHHLTVTKKKITVNHPERVKAGQQFKIKGKALLPVDKIIASVDGYKIAEKVVSSGEYKFKTQLNQTGDDRKLVIKGFRSNGTAVAERKDKIDVVNDDLIRGIPYFYQYYNDLHPSATCQNTCLAMVLGYYGWSGEPDDITRSWGRRKAQKPSGLAEIFNDYAQAKGLGVRMQAHYDLDVSHIRQLLRAGKPVILHNDFTSYGHLVTLVGFDGTYYYVNDPAGRWNQQYKGGYPNRTSTNGKYVKYHKDNLERAALWYHELYSVE